MYQFSTIRPVGILRAPITVLLLTLWVVVGFQGCSTLGPDRQLAQEDPKPRQVQASFLSVPLSFEANQGQTDAKVKLLSRGPGYGLFLTRTEAVLALRKAKSTQSGAATDQTPSESAVLRMRLVGANDTPEVTGETALPGKVNYFRGNDPTKWRRNVPTYAQAKYENVYQGIDLIYYGNQQQLEYDFVVAPGQDPASITMAFEGAERLELDASGDLVLHTEGGAVRQRKPIIYQEVGGQRHDIAGDYVIKLDDQVGFQVAAYDATKPLIIDPILVFSTYLGGSGIDRGLGIAVNGAGQATVTGSTEDYPGFPTQNPLQPANGGNNDVFITQFTADGSALVFSTYLGGSGIDGGSAIAVDSLGQVYVTGTTWSTDFPTENALQPNLAVSGCGGNPTDAFVAQLSPDGSALVFSTYLGGCGSDSGNGIAVDGDRQIYVTGATASTNFPTHNPLQPSNGGGTGTTFDAFVAKFTADGSALAYATYLGGSGYDDGRGIAVDGWGRAAITGRTGSTDFPTQNPLQPTFGGDIGDAFVAKLTADGSALNFATYLGGSQADNANGIAMDSTGQVSVTGVTLSTDFPTQNPLQLKNNTLIPFKCMPGMEPFCLRPNSDAFVAQLTADGSALRYATYLGGSHDDKGVGIALNGNGQVLVIGSTASDDFPTMNPLGYVLGNPADTFLAQLTTDGSALRFSSFLDGSVGDLFEIQSRPRGGIAVDEVGQVYVTGWTDNNPFFPPLNTVNPFQPASGGIDDAFVTKIDPLRDNVNNLLNLSALDTAFSRTPCDGATAGTFTITATFTNISTDTLSNFLIAVQTLTGGNVLCNANGGPGGAGALLTVPLQSDLVDGQLSPGEAFVVELPVGLQSFNPFTFVVDVLGEEAP